jgi:hypothetical protein
MVQDADLARGYIGAATDTSSVSAHSAGGGRGALVYQSDTTPVDGTSGTYAGLAPAGALLVAPNGDDAWALYQNTGTQASPVWTERSAASGGGSGPQVATVEISSTELLDAHNTAVEIVAAGAADEIVAVTRWRLRMKPGVTLYTLDGGGVTIELRNGEIAFFPILTTDASGVLDQDTESYYSPAVGDHGANVEDVAGQPLLFKLSAPVTLGNGTLLVSVVYDYLPATA